jgi:sn-glycerol 3-phosphate transport system permease protein
MSATTFVPASPQPARAAPVAGREPVPPWRVANPASRTLEIIGAWLLGILWVSPLLYAVWTAFHPPGYAVNFDLFAPLTLRNFAAAWNAAPFARYFFNTTMLVTLVLVAQFVLCTPAAFAFARLNFRGRDVLFAIVLLQLMIMPEVLLVGNYRTLARIGLVDTIVAMALPYLGSAFGIFLLRQTFLTIPQELDDAARLEGCSLLARIWRVYVPLARPTYIAYGLVSVSYHWNNFLWPLVITNSVTTRPLTVGLSVFATTDQGIDWSIITAATLMTAAPLLVSFLLFQRQFVQSFMRAGIR